MLLYQRRLLALESEFADVREGIRKIHDELMNDSNGDKALDKTKVKLQLDIALGLVRVIKEQVSFYLKLGQDYDMIRLLEDITDELANQAPEIGAKVMKIIDCRWRLSAMDNHED